MGAEGVGGGLRGVALPRGPHGAAPVLRAVLRVAAAIAVGVGVQRVGEVFDVGVELAQRVVLAVQLRALDPEQAEVRRQKAAEQK